MPKGFMELQNKRVPVVTVYVCQLPLPPADKHREKQDGVYF